MRNYLAELVGTFFLTLAVSLSILFGGYVATPLVAGLTLGLFVYTLGHISGGHFNPAVTFGMWSVKKLEAKDTLFYILFQALGAVLAMLLARVLSGDSIVVTVVEEWKLGVAEAIGAFVLVFGVSSVVWKKVDARVSGLVVGGSLFLGILLTFGLSAGLVNPAVALGVGAISWMYMLAPFVGGVLAAWTFRYLINK